MNLDTLDLFVEVARKRSFAAVAKERNVDPSSVSRAIADLEAELGLRLFQRTTRTMTLTEAGDVYLSRIEPLTEEIARAREAALQVTGRPRGLLRITASVTFGQMCIMPLLGEFRALYPDLKVECLFTDANLDLVADRIDLAVRLAPIVEGDLIVSKLMDTRYRVVASPAYLASHRRLGDPATCRRIRCCSSTLRLSATAGSSAMRQAASRACRSMATSRSPRLALCSPPQSTGLAPRCCRTGSSRTRSDAANSSTYCPNIGRRRPRSTRLRGSFTRAVLSCPERSGRWWTSCG
jgi:DNA-binding transcriptional LysR family regulator